MRAQTPTSSIRLLIALYAVVASAVDARAGDAPTSETGPTLYLGSGFAVAGRQDTRINDPTKPPPPPSVPALGGVDFDVEYQDAALAEIGLGYRVARHLRVEANVDYRSHTIENVAYRPHRGDFHFVAGMANVYADHAIGKQVERGDIPILIPYVGAGVGVLWSKARAEVELPNRKIRGESAEFAWNVMVGTEIPITRWVAFNVGYRYLESLDHRWLLRNGANTAGDVDGAYRTHEGRMGLRIGY
ncbi:outer membrane beta-barrel protein [Myxococcota bacterium]|nr:outer membrane beta-barrel protein [Myxococcota bacterium]